MIFHTQDVRKKNQSSAFNGDYQIAVLPCVTRSERGHVSEISIV